MGINRTSDRTIELFSRYNLLNQADGTFIGLDVTASIDGTNNFSDSYTPALGAVVSWELGSFGAVYLEPMWVNNSNPLPSELEDDNDTFMIGLGARDAHPANTVRGRRVDSARRVRTGGQSRSRSASRSAPAGILPAQFLERLRDHDGAARARRHVVRRLVPGVQHLEEVLLEESDVSSSDAFGAHVVAVRISLIGLCDNHFAGAAFIGTSFDGLHRPQRLRSTPNRAPAGTWTDHPLAQLTFVRVREFIREPEALFWSLAFPILLAAGLGIAFRNRPPEVLKIAVVTPELAESLRARAAARRADADARRRRTCAANGPGGAARRGRRQRGEVVYRYDDTNPEGRTARMLADAAPCSAPRAARIRYRPAIA